ncbi:MAG: O-antigen polymerase, partial [Candidatus Hodarchaeota archaeon]
YLVLLPLLTIIWIARFILLSTGSYYHIHRTDYQFTSPYHSVLAQLSGYGLIFIGALFLILFSEDRKKRRKKILVISIIAFILELVWHVPSGGAEPIVLTILVPLFAFIFIRRKIPTKIITILTISCFPLLAILGTYQYIVSSFFQPSKLELTTVPKAIIMAEEELQFGDIDIIAAGADRFYDGKSLGYLLMHYSNDYNYELGNTYKNIPVFFIPRFIYPNKPVFTTALNEWYALLEGGSMPTTFWGEAYINFSWLGIVIMSYILGLGMKHYDYIFIKRSKKSYWVYLYVFSALHIIRLPMEVIVIWISFLFKIIIIAFVFTKIQSILTKGKVKSVLPPSFKIRQNN